MKLGLSTWSLLGIDVYGAVRAIGDAGYEYVELWGEVPHAYPEWVDRKKLKDVLSTYDMVATTHAPFTDLNIASPFQPVKTAVERALTEFVEFSAYLGGKMVTVHPGSVHNELLVPRSAEAAISTLKKMVTAAGGRLSVNVENQMRGSSKYHYPLAATEESLRAILAGVEGSEVTFDTGHAHASGQDLLKFSTSLGERVKEVHLSDNAGSSDDHLVPGEGTAPLMELLGHLKGDVLVCLELNPHRYGRDDALRGIDRVKQMLASPR